MGSANLYSFSLNHDKADTSSKGFEKAQKHKTISLFHNIFPRILVVVLHAKITGLVNQDLPRKDITACVEAGQVQTAKWVGLKNELNERSSYETTQAVPHLKGRNHM